MSMQTVTFEIPEESLKIIDEIASNLEADRGTALREAVEMYLADYAEECAELAEASRQADAGETISHDEMLQRFEAMKQSNKRPAAA